MSRKTEVNALYSEMLNCLAKLSDAMSEVKDPEKKQSFEEAVSALQETLKVLSKSADYSKSLGHGQSPGGLADARHDEEDI